MDVLFKDYCEERNQADLVVHQELASVAAIQSTKRIAGSSSSKLIPISHCFVPLAALLERNLDVMSKLHENAWLQHLFLMNNMNYMVHEVKRSELKRIFGDEWIRDHNWKCRKYAMDYERASWGSALLLLRYEFYIENHYQGKTPELLPCFRGMLLRYEFYLKNHY